MTSTFLQLAVLTTNLPVAWSSSIFLRVEGNRLASHRLHDVEMGDTHECLIGVLIVSGPWPSARPGPLADPSSGDRAGQS